MRQATRWTCLTLSSHPGNCLPQNSIVVNHFMTGSVKIILKSAELFRCVDLALYGTAQARVTIRNNFLKAALPSSDLDRSHFPFVIYIAIEFSTFVLSTQS